MAIRRDRQMTTGPKRKRHLNRSDWLALSIEVLSQEGGAKLNIDHVCHELGVTKGSFYAHFKNRADFIEKLVTYWAETYTQSVIDAMNELENSTAEIRLLALMRFLHRNRSGLHDFVIRAWAAQEPLVAKAVRKVDGQRFRYIRQIFHEMGFRGTELDLRTRIFVVFHSAVESIRLPSSQSKVDEEIRFMHAFFTRT